MTYVPQIMQFLNLLKHRFLETQRYENIAYDFSVATLITEVFRAPSLI